MKKQLFNLLLLISLFASVSAQTTKEARKIEEFGRIQCGEFMARMDLIFQMWQNSPDSEIHVIYYGGRFRKISPEQVRGKRNQNIIQLDYSHRDDGLNWAKTLHHYLTTYRGYEPKIRQAIKEKLVLINGGFRESEEVEVWLIPVNGTTPKPTPNIDEKYIKFRNDRPRRVRNFTNCYGEYETQIIL